MAKDAGPEQAEWTTHVSRVLDALRQLQLGVDAAVEASECSPLEQLGILSCSLAHELDNLVTPLIASAQLASEHPTDEPLVRRVLERTVRTGQAISMLTRTILAAGRPDEACRQKVGWSIGEAVDVAIDHVFGVERCVVVVPDEGLPSLKVTADRFAVEQVLINLLSNAQQAMGRSKRGAPIEVSVGRAEQHVVVRVIDSGPGIPHALRERLFRPWAGGERSAVAASLARPRSGLGLFVSRVLAEAQGGRLDLVRTGDTGTAFALLLPASVAVAAAG